MATNDEIIAKLPLALVELRKQNKDAATKAAEDRAKEFEVLMSSRDAAAVGSVERDDHASANHYLQRHPRATEAVGGRVGQNDRPRVSLGRGHTCATHTGRATSHR